MELTGKTVLKGLVSAPGVMCLLVVVWLISLGWPYDEVAAAWVQAIGSIGAIFIAVWVFDRQSRLQISVTQAQELEQTKKIVAVARYTWLVSRNALAFVEFKSDRDDLNSFKVSLEECVFLLKQVEFIQIANTEIALAWLELRHAVSDVQRSVEQELSGQGFTGTDLIKMRLAVERADSALRRIQVAAPGICPELDLEIASVIPRQ